MPGSALKICVVVVGSAQLYGHNDFVLGYNWAVTTFLQFKHLRAIGYFMILKANGKQG
jgi:hypothetical protein